VAAIMIQLVKQKLFSQRFIAVENNYTYKEILSEVQLGLGKPAPKFEVGKWRLKIAAMAESLAALFFGRQRQLSSAIIKAAFNHQKYSNQKIKTHLDFEFTPVKKSIKDIAAFYLSERQKAKSTD
jgi:dihydroflavonol-4-reductase